MKTRIITTVAVIMLMVTGSFAKDKSPITFTVERAIHVPAESLWKAVGEEFAEVHKSHPIIDHSDYLSGSDKAGEGCERVCAFDDGGKKYVHEKQINYDPVNMSFRALIFKVGKLPLAEGGENFADYKVSKIDEESSKVELTLSLMTDPYFMGKMSKKKFMKTINNYLIGIEHYVLTGETVTKDNFKKIKKQYES